MRRQKRLEGLENRAMGGPLDVIADPTISVEEAAARSGGTGSGEHDVRAGGLARLALDLTAREAPEGAPGGGATFSI